MPKHSAVPLSSLTVSVELKGTSKRYSVPGASSCMRGADGAGMSAGGGADMDRPGSERPGSDILGDPPVERLVLGRFGMDDGAMVFVFLMSDALR